MTIFKLVNLGGLVSARGSDDKLYCRMVKPLNNAQPVTLGTAPYCSLDVYGKSRETKPDSRGPTEVLQLLFKAVCVCIH